MVCQDNFLENVRVSMATFIALTQSSRLAKTAINIGYAVIWALRCRHQHF